MQKFGCLAFFEDHRDEVKNDVDYRESVHPKREMIENLQIIACLVTLPLTWPIVVFIGAVNISGDSKIRIRF